VWLDNITVKTQKTPMEFHLTDIIMPRPGSMLWTIISFLILLFVLRKWAWNPIINALERREKTIKGDLDNARQERDKAEQLRQEYQQNLANAKKESNQIVQEARRVAEEVKETTVREAKETAHNTIAKAKQEIEAEKVRVSHELKTEVATLVTDTVKRILQYGLTPQDQQRIIAAGMKELEKVNGNGTE
jgi:F-type H+-transporting ATPase subunit b